MKNDIEIKHSIDLEDLLLVPKPISHYTTEINVASRLTKTLTLDAPVLLPSSDVEKLIEVAELGGMGIVSEELSQTDQVKKVKEFKEKNADLRIGATVALNSDVIERTFAMAKAGLDVVFIDSLYAPFNDMTGVIRQIRQQGPSELQVVAGNAFTAEGARSLIEAGADAIKLGSAKHDLVEFGVGNSDYNSIITVVDECALSNIPVVFDGEIKTVEMFIKIIALGVETIVIGGDVEDFISKLKSAIMYTGNENIETFIQNAEFVQVK